MKFGRKYKLFIEIPGEAETIAIEPPITIQFQVQRNNLASANTFNCQIYNLSKKTRDKIFQDRYNPKVYKKIIFQAGYDSLSTIFVGNIFQAYSARDGANVITTITARDGGFDISNTMSRFTLNAGVSNLEIIKQLANDFQHIQIGEFGEIEGNKKRGVVCMGNTFELIKRETDDHFFVDLEKLYVMKDIEALDAVVPLINASTGLLGTPRREESYLSADMLFEPRIGIGQIVDIESEVQDQFNGQFKVIGISHAGIISDAVGGECMTTLNLLLGSQVFGQYNQNVITSNPLRPNEASNPVNEDSESPLTLKGRVETSVTKPKQFKIINKDTSSKFISPLKGIITGKYDEPRIGHRHKGIDKAAKIGASVKAMAGGTVTMAQWFDGYGKCVQVDHGNGYSTLYAHLSAYKVSKGQTVSQNSIIGLVGSTGHSSGPHLHYEIRKNGKPVNPMSYIKE